MKFEKINDGLFKSGQALNEADMLNAKGGEVWSTGCGKTYIKETDSYEDCCEFYDSISEESFFG